MAKPALKDTPSAIYEVVVHIGTRTFKLLTLGYGFNEVDQRDDARARAYKWAGRPIEEVHLEEPTFWA